jgi:hypothetical protein
MPGFSPHQKLTCALCFLAYSTSADHLDDYIWMAETMVFETVSHFCSVIIACFSDTYLHSPTVADLEFLLSSYEKVGWIGCLGCLDVMKWQWKTAETAPKVTLTVNNNNYDMACYLTNGIYLDWALFMKTVSEPSSNKQQHFSEQQEARQKDVERGFGVVQVRCLCLVFCFFLLCTDLTDSCLFSNHLSTI